MSSRWHRDKSAAEGDEVSEGSAAKRNYLDEFGVVRALLAGVMGKHQLDGLRTHEDVAVRCAVYRYCDMTAGQMREAYEGDGSFFLNNAFWNDAVWQQAQTRDELRKLCDVDKTDELRVRRSRTRSDYLLEEHPDWFRSDGPPLGEKDISLAELATLVRSIQAEVHDRLAAVKSRLTVVL